MSGVDVIEIRKFAEKGSPGNGHYILILLLSFTHELRSNGLTELASISWHSCATSILSQSGR